MTVKVDEHGLTVQASRPAFAQNIAFTGVSAQSAPFSAGPNVNAYNPDGTLLTQPNNTTHIRVVANAACWIAFGTNPTAASASASSIYIPAFTPEYFWVARGERLAVVQDAAGGNLNIAELAN